MAKWTPDELDAVTGARELRVAGMRMDGTLRKGVIIWSVRVDDDIFIRSVDGPNASWFRGTQVRGEGRIQAGGVTRAVIFVPVDDNKEQVDDAYRAKYGTGSSVRAINAPKASATTMRLDPI
ncbi:DUF2255 family protein [Glaciihabitans sp. dw_435]|uniref:DUF2255 family protein n=1 Tax=Glaciihabitans sp. dw_435 TaxID=2720081 RepID=UPI001BD6B956|nr:DUF2255 family protein [Glaciihabitans sp. dw_435]